MTERCTCDDVRERAFEYRRGELDADERESVEAHLESCAACRDYVEKLFSLMSSPPAVDQPTDGYADALFGEIEARIESEKRRGGADAVELGAEEEEFAPAASGVRWGTAAIGLAAGFLLAVGIGLFVSSSGMFSADAPRGGENMAENQPGTAGEGEDEDKLTDAERFAQLRPRPTNRAGVGILSSKDAQWSLEGEDELVLDLRSGTVLVEYLPRDGRSFRVEAPNMRVRVVGTIFYVTANGASSAGVVTGSVEVDSAGEEPVALEEGRRVKAGGAVEPIPEDAARALRAQVDVRRHHAALRQRMNSSDDEQSREDASESEPRRAEVAERARPEQRPSSRPELTGALARRRASAEEAIRAGQYGRAESIYRDLLDELDASHPAAPSIHLDLAGLYLEQMNRPKKALPYLREFLRKWPNDVAAAAVQRRLCVLSRELGVDEPRCDESTSDQ